MVRNRANVINKKEEKDIELKTVEISNKSWDEEMKHLL